MKKLILTGIILFSTLGAMAQVGIGNANPQATLDVSADLTDNSKADAVLVPRMTVTELATKDNAFLAAQNGSLVFVTSGTGTSGKTIDVDGVGFYYYDAPSIKWVKVGGGGAATAPTFRTATNNVLSDSDVGNYVIYEGPGGAIDIDVLTLTEGAIIRILDNGPLFFFSSALGNIATNVNPGQSIQGTTFSFICDGTKWLNFGN